MPARRRIALSLATAALLVPVTVGCSALDTALDCVETADTIATSVDKLQQAVSSAAEDPTQARQALDDIDKELNSLGDKTDNADLEQAYLNLEDGVAEVRKAIESGDTTPDLSRITDAAGEITKVCTPG
jgi:phage tail sheath gpL-like